MQRICLVQRLSLVSVLLLVALPVPTYAEQAVPFEGNRQRPSGPEMCTMVLTRSLPR